MRFFVAGAFLLVHVGQAQPWPLRSISPPAAARAVSILQVRIQELKYGHEGPDYFSVDRSPFTGKQELVEVTLFGQEEIGSVRFELIDELGQPLAVLPAFRTSDGADADEYLVQVDVPRQPFRFRIQGEDRRGRSFTNVFKRLFVPEEGSASPVRLPAGLDPGQARLLQNLVDAAAQETASRFAAAI